MKRNALIVSVLVVLVASFVVADEAEKIGQVTVEMGDTSCKVPYAPDYIQKVKSRGTVGKKRKTAKC